MKMAMEKLEIETYFGKCKCCLKYGYLRPMWDEHEDENEVYGKMLTECFAIPWTIESSEEEDQICEDCIWKLREASKFKQQILQCRTKQQSEVDELEEVKSEPEEAYDVEYLDEDLLHKNADDTEANEQNGDCYEEDYLEDIETIDDEYNVDDDDDDNDYKAEIEEDDSSQSSTFSNSKVKTEPARKRAARKEDVESDADTPKPKWPKKLPRQERWKTYRQYTDDDMKLAVDAVMEKTLNQRQAAIKFKVPAKTLGAKIRAIRNNEEVNINAANLFAGEMRALLQILNIIPFRNRAAVTSCFYCCDRMEFDTAQEMRAHTRMCHPDQPDRIEIALRPAWTNELVKIDIHDLKCTVCDENLHWTQVYTHLEEVHATTIDSKHKLVPFHLGNSNQCVLCQESFTSFTQLDSHMNKHYPNYMCGHCGEPFATMQRFRAHERTHRTGSYPCKLCNKVFTLQKYMKKHITLKHMKIAKSKCFYCDEVFVTEYNRHAHIVEVHSEHVRIYTCEICGDIFDWLRTFTRHMARRHNTEFYCKLCAKSFISSKALENHNMIHNGDDFVCPVCQKSYSSFNSLKSHVKYSHKNHPKNVKGIFGIQ